MDELDMSIGFKTGSELIDTVSPEEFLRLAASLPVLDARSPAEYERAHVPNAVSWPLFTTEERAQVGIAFDQQGREAAVLRGLELVGGQLGGKFRRAVEITEAHGTGRQVCLYCWRGGMRSSSLAWMLAQGGLRVHLLAGGYRGYRNFLRGQLAAPRRMYVLAGMTGSGKTDILRELARQGEQVVDLEGLAHHRGSAFGAIGQGEQPYLEALENQLYEQLRHFSADKPIWIEDEDRRIGKIALSDEVFRFIAEGDVILLDVPRNERVKRLVSMYTDLDMEPEQLRKELADSIKRLERRLGSESCSKVCALVWEGNYEEAVDIILKYYDILYQKQLNKSTRPVRLSFDTAGKDIWQTAQALRQAVAC